MCFVATGQDNFLPHAAVIGSIVAAVVGCIQLLFALAKQRRENKIARAKFGYDLIDSILTNHPVLKLLESMDASTSKAEEVRQALKAPSLARGEEAKAIDWLLLYFDRLEHALQADLTTFENIRMPLGYYVGLLAMLKTELQEYIEVVRYDRVAKFLTRFESWRNKV
jgi:hypothetical protein